jgi:hypothetical protein
MRGASVRGFIDGEYQDGEVRGLTFIAGERGMGKTTEMIRLIETCGGAVVFFDTVGTHVEILKRKGFKEFNQPGAFLEYVAANLGRRVRVVYVPRDEYPEEHCIEVCKMVRAFGVELVRRMGDGGGIILVIDEIDEYCGGKWGERRMPDPLYNLAHFGRHYHVSMVSTARDPTTLSTKFRRQCACMRIFRVTENAEWFEKRIGKANVAKLGVLQKTYFLKWDAGVIDAQVCGGPRAL